MAARSDWVMSLLNPELQDGSPPSSLQWPKALHDLTPASFQSYSEWAGPTGLWVPQISSFLSQGLYLWCSSDGNALSLNLSVDVSFLFLRTLLKCHLLWVSFSLSHLLSHYLIFFTAIEKQKRVFYIASRFFIVWAMREAQNSLIIVFEMILFANALDIFYVRYSCMKAEIL